MDSAELLWNKNDQSIRFEVSGVRSSQNGIVPQNINKVSGISRTYFLLVGYSIENLLKGFIVNNDPSTITDGKQKNNLIKLFTIVI
ncbi:hypothetical protein [Spirochaeta cellobiosiphila]|uniref:hypothetical protein n=1 Tax=Spirochaeta cellobiosiphila TaxID=504483 RepID=UPI00048F3527|nr:hypothetical protein [Spirochaeta cellobiosiphila]